MFLFIYCYSYIWVQCLAESTTESHDDLFSMAILGPFFTCMEQSVIYAIIVACNTHILGQTFSRTWVTWFAEWGQKYHITGHSAIHEVVATGTFWTPADISSLALQIMHQDSFCSIMIIMTELEIIMFVTKDNVHLKEKKRKYIYIFTFIGTVSCF